MPNERLANRFGVIIRRLRLQSGLSQEAFAHICGLHRTYIGSIERGEKTVTIETVLKLAHALDLTLSQLFLEVEKELESHDADY